VKGKASAVALLMPLLFLFPLLLAGCGPQAAEQAQEARSSYISARAVLVGVQEFPGRVEEMLKSQSEADLTASVQGLTSSTRNLLSSANSAFTASRQKAEQLKSLGDDKYGPYAESLLELIGLNEQALTAYSEFIGLSNSLAASMPYNGDPNQLMPSLDYLDSRIVTIQGLMDQIQQKEAEAEQLYLSLINT
jgi:hypothetical protein